MPFREVELGEVEVVVSMSGPSATAKPMSAKIAVSSSITWLIGCTRPVSAGGSRTGSVTSTVSVLSRWSSARFLSVSGARQARSDTILEAVDQRALRLALVRRHAAECLQQRRHRAALAQRGDAYGLERGLVIGDLDGGENFGLERCNIGHDTNLG